MKLTSLLASLIIVPALLLSGCGEGKKTCENGNVLNGKVCITMPADFARMPDDMLKQKYPMAQRPTEAWYATSEGSKVSLAFSQTTQAMKDTQLGVFAEAMKKQLSAFFPKVSETRVNGSKAVLIEMTTPDNANPGGLDIVIIMQLSSMNGKLLITSFSMTEDLKDKYYQSGKTTLGTLVW